ncbi:hypothetical protein E3N88_17219 [Mikania micrantha]|uniref:Uncharacterized protein n=1 Tax=Mikania micrantha TaxID=192012 RepID=A0A5N6NT18_9ASTR|nr:hypothetical protein E3N88_17219 [Mikania micrantha]
MAHTGLYGPYWVKSISFHVSSVRIEKARRVVLLSTGRLAFKSLSYVSWNVCTMNETGGRTDQYGPSCSQSLSQAMKRKPATHQSKSWRKVLTRRAITRETYRKTLGEEPGKRAIKGIYKSIKKKREDRPTTYKIHIKESIRFQRRGEGLYARKEDQNSLRFSLVFHYLFVILCKRHSPGNSSYDLVSPKKIGVYNAPN